MPSSLIQKLSLSPAPFITREESGGTFWRLDSLRQIIRASGDAAYLYIPLLFYDGTVISAVKVRWGGGGTGDGIYANLQRREGEGSNKYFTDVTSVDTFTRGAADPEMQTSELSGFPQTIDAGWSYVLHFTSQQVVSFCEIYDVILYVKDRLI